MSFKVDGSSRGKPQSLGSRIERDGNKVRDKSGAQFGSSLGRHFGDNQEEALKKMVMDIEKQGKHLSEHVDIAELKNYKRLVMEFLSEAVRGFGKFSKDSFLDRRGRHRVFATVKTVNEKLEELTKAVLSSEKDNLDVLGKIEDIRGLILDLVL